MCHLDIPAPAQPYRPSAPALVSLRLTISVPASPVNPDRYPV